MFTGIIIELAEVISLDKKDNSARLVLLCPQASKDASLGDSIAVNGVCLTVVDIVRETLAFDVSFATLASTNIGELKRGDRVNIEPALRLQSKLGGHLVLGHVEAVGRIKSRRHKANAEEIVISSPKEINQYLIEKGSVAVDGISLTVLSISPDSFSVVIIPHTAKLTTIGFKPVGATVNLEPDIIAKYVHKYTSMHTQGLNKASTDASLLNALRHSGYIDK